MSQEEAKKHHWHFQRIGGLDQVVLSKADDLRYLEQLDPKLWVALSCPADGLEFNKRTLAFLDTDADGHIRVPDVIAATNWVCARLNSLDSLINASDTLALEIIDTENDEGKKLLATAHAILQERKTPDQQFLTEDDVVLASQQASQALFNGDGVFPPLAALDEDVRLFVQDAIAVMGGVADVSTQPGINAEIADAFAKTLSNWQAWRDGLKCATSVLENDTRQAWQLMQALKDKIDDYFLRVDLASYAPQAQVALNVDEKSLVPAQNGVLENAALKALPLAKIIPLGALNLASGLNPVWRVQVEQFAQLVRPLLAQPDVMTRQEWGKIQTALDSYAHLVESEPALVAVQITVEPTSSVDKLGEERINTILQSDVLNRFFTMIEKDTQTPVAAADIAELERLVIYHKYLYRLLMNFVSFRDFFDLQGALAAFQAGQLYIDGRRCDLCLPVVNVDQHMVLSGYAELFLLYCECSRKGQLNAEKKTKTIVAAVTLGNADLLLEGRNGVFIDSHGDDWDARVVKAVVKPISLREAIWAPYKRIGKLVSDQLNKWAAAKDSEITQASIGKVQAVSDGMTSPAPASAPAAAPKFDIGRNVGIFAAIGLALGALGTAVASIASALFGLAWWQFPILFGGLFLLISGPSWVLAWLKLRQRTLGPLLEASGWAVNGRVKINYSLGGQLTSLAQLPPNSKRNLIDPLRDKKKTGRWLFLCVLLVAGLAAGGWLWYQRTYVNVVETAATSVVGASSASQS